MNHLHHNGVPVKTFQPELTIGAATCGRVERRLGLGRAVMLASLVFPLSMLLYPAAHGSTLTADGETLPPDGGGLEVSLLHLSLRFCDTPQR